MRQFIRATYPGVLTLLGAVALVQSGQAGELKESADDVYRTVCGYCHESGPGPALNARKLPAIYVSQVVRHGQGAMPAFRPAEISDEQLHSIAEAIERSSGGGQ